MLAAVTNQRPVGNATFGNLPKALASGERIETRLGKGLRPSLQKQRADKRRRSEGPGCFVEEGEALRRSGRRS